MLNVLQLHIMLKSIGLILKQIHIAYKLKPQFKFL